MSFALPPPGSYPDRSKTVEEEESVSDLYPNHPISEVSIPWVIRIEVEGVVEDILLLEVNPYDRQFKKKKFTQYFTFYFTSLNTSLITSFILY